MRIQGIHPADYGIHIPPMTTVKLVEAQDHCSFIFQSGQQNIRFLVAEARSSLDCVVAGKAPI